MKARRVYSLLTSFVTMDAIATIRYTRQEYMMSVEFFRRQGRRSEGEQSIFSYRTRAAIETVLPILLASSQRAMISSGRTSIQVVHVLFREHCKSFLVSRNQRWWWHRGACRRHVRMVSTVDQCHRVRKHGRWPINIRIKVVTVGWRDFDVCVIMHFIDRSYRVCIGARYHVRVGIKCDVVVPNLIRSIMCVWYRCVSIYTMNLWIK
jgi:hypothetical protein